MNAQQKTCSLIVIIVVFLMWGVKGVVASELVLKDGRVLKGDIVDKSDQSVRISVGGAVSTYFSDEVKTIDGVDWAQSVKKQVVEAPKPAATKTVVPIASTTSTPMSPERKALIKKFLDVFGTTQAMEQNFKMMIDQMAKERPEEAAKMRDRIVVNEILDELLPMYDKYFTDDDLNAYIAFYQSPQGQKLTQSLPNMMRDSIEISTRYVQRKFPELAE